MIKAKRIYFHKTSKTGNYWYHFIKGWLAILDGLISILSLGSVWSSFEYEYTFRNTFNDKKKGKVKVCK